MTTELLTTPREVSEPCDRCGFDAVVVVILASGATLAFCGHHGREHYESLLATGSALFGDLTFTDTR